MCRRPWATDVGAKAVHRERLGDHLGAPLQADPGLEQRRDLDLVLDPEQLGEVERRQQREAGLALGDQKADRLARVDVLERLRDDHEQAFGGRLLRGERAEVDLHRRHAFDQGAIAEVGDAVARIVGRVIHARSSCGSHCAAAHPARRVGEPEPERREPGAQTQSSRRKAWSVAIVSARSISSIRLAGWTSRAARPACIARAARASSRRKAAGSVGALAPNTATSSSACLSARVSGRPADRGCRRAQNPARPWRAGGGLRPGSAPAAAPAGAGASPCWRSTECRSVRRGRGRPSWRW